VMGESVEAHDYEWKSRQVSVTLPPPRAGLPAKFAKRIPKVHTVAPYAFPRGRMSAHPSPRSRASPRASHSPVRRSRRSVSPIKVKEPKANVSRWNAVLAKLKVFKKVEDAIKGTSPVSRRGSLNKFCAVVPPASRLRNNVALFRSPIRVEPSSGMTV
jgi:hypothetical protein